MTHWYNEIDPFVAEWCENITGCAVDRRSIKEVQPHDLAGVTRAHFFAGLGTWDLALELAGWPAEREVWTGSCPCQPFSVAGKRKGAADDRHLFPAWFRLIRECRPGAIFGEQVASEDGLGWLDAVFDALESEGYACGAAVLPAAGVGAPHKRERIFFVADRESERRHGGKVATQGIRGSAQRLAVLADRSGARLEERGGERGNALEELPAAQRDGVAGRLARAHGQRLEEQGLHAGRRRQEQAAANERGPWDLDQCEWRLCADGKARPVEPGLEPVVDGVSFRLADGRARADTSRAKLIEAIGNAIVPQVAALFVESFLESKP